MRILKRLLLFTLILIPVAVIVAGMILCHSKPKYNGRLELIGPTDTVKVFYDDYGIPHISASSAYDAFFALGYVHAQERIFQMDLLRRVGSGRLAEWFGKQLTPVDAFFRTLGIHQHSLNSVREFMNTASDELKNETFAYLDGINAFIRTAPSPPEYLLPGIDKEPFQLVDIFDITGYMAFSFAEGIRTDPVLNQINRNHGAEYLKRILNIDSAETASVHFSTTALLASVDRVIQAPFRGSNAWAVSSSRSVSGKPLFANDTHIGYSQPCVWFEAHLEFPGTSIYGNFLAGFPYPLTGHTRHHAWGLTMLENDDLDFFYEKINPADTAFYLAGSQWLKFETRKEILKRHKAPDTSFTVRSTRNGPVINPFIESLKNDSVIVTLRWLFTRLANTSLQAGRGMMSARTVEEMRDACKLISSPGLNIIYADTADNIAWWAAGKMIKRKPRQLTTLIGDGSSNEDSEISFFEFEENPHEVNPQRGFVYSANRLADSLLKTHAGYYAPPDRSIRIEKLLSAGKRYSMDDMKLVQTDVVNGQYAAIAHRWADELQRMNIAATTERQQMISILKNWNGEHHSGSQGPVIFYKLLSDVLDFAMADELDSASYASFKTSHVMKNAYTRFLFDDRSPWWDNLHTTETESRMQILARAFEKTSGHLVTQLGPLTQNWKWKRVHTLSHIHAVGRQKPMDRVFNVGPFGVAGGNETISCSGFPVTSDGEYKVSYGPAMRIVIDLADIENGESILPTGQSGHFLSPHYSDQSALYNEFKYRKMIFGRDPSRDKGRILLIIPQTQKPG